MKGGQTSNVFYTFGFLLLYIHLLMNLVSLATQKLFFHSSFLPLSISPIGNPDMTVQISLIEVLLLGGFALFTIIGIFIERIKLIGLRKDAAIGWKYRNRLKMGYSVIAILLTVWATVHGYFVMKELDWVWLSGSIVIVIYSAILLSFPRMKTKKVKTVG